MALPRVRAATPAATDAATELFSELPGCQPPLLRLPLREDDEGDATIGDAEQGALAGPHRSLHKCRHVNLVTKRVPGLPDEQEYLFAPYSAFTALGATWNAGTAAEPHVIELEAAVDNQAEPEDLPLAPWS